jgi:type IV pilus assembly protein PilV
VAPVCGAFTLAEALVRPPFIAGSAFGFTLVEILVAILVLAIGILGAAGAQVAALRARHGTGLMSGGVQLGATLADNMRTAGMARAGDATNPYLQLDYDAEADGAPAAPERQCYAGSACTVLEMAQFDVYNAKHAIYTRFPGGRITVCRDDQVWAESQRALAWECNAAGRAPVVIKIGWRPKRSSGASGGEAAFLPAVALVLGGGAL